MITIQDKFHLRCQLELLQNGIFGDYYASIWWLRYFYFSRHGLGILFLFSISTLEAITSYRELCLDLVNFFFVSILQINTCLIDLVSKYIHNIGYNICHMSF